MSDEPAFLDTIRRNPRDDAPRLVYADWLDEKGEHPKAEYLRLVVRIADDLRTSFHFTRDARRLMELVVELPAAWRKAVGRWYFAIDRHPDEFQHRSDFLRFRGAFNDSLLEDWVEEFEALVPRRPFNDWVRLRESNGPIS